MKALKVMTSRNLMLLKNLTRKIASSRQKMRVNVRLCRSPLFIVLGDPTRRHQHLWWHASFTSKDTDFSQQSLTSPWYINNNIMQYLPILIMTSPRLDISKHSCYSSKDTCLGWAQLSMHVNLDTYIHTITHTHTDSQTDRHAYTYATQDQEVSEYLLTIWVAMPLRLYPVRARVAGCWASSWLSSIYQSHLNC